MFSLTPVKILLRHNLPGAPSISLLFLTSTFFTRNVTLSSQSPRPPSHPTRPTPQPTRPTPHPPTPTPHPHPAPIPGIQAMQAGVSLDAVAFNTAWAPSVFHFWFRFWLGVFVSWILRFKPALFVLFFGLSCVFSPRFFFFFFFSGFVICFRAFLVLSSGFECCSVWTFLRSGEPWHANGPGCASANPWKGCRESLGA